MTQPDWQDSVLPVDELLIEERDDEVVLKKARRKRRKTLAQWMLDCPVKNLKFERTVDSPKDIKL